MWGKWLFWRNRNESLNAAEENEEMMRLYEEIGQAKRDWENARRHFEYAMGKDQVDYAVFAIEAAEKRYEMLLRKAKTLQVRWPAWTREVQA
ncbi:DUF2508 family protein [Paenibacillus humicola]|uniref:DUF2508 family protein n=1 Tax=Paenibacillus humicola TaxID=3110540 RepID=UPI00237AFF27|nr:DUF2508 family protein [Paenibacillus humicola]